MLDCHCHIDRYPDPHRILSEAASHNVFVVAVTNLPSHFDQGRPHIANYKLVRPAVGMHPLAAERHEKEMPLFLDLVHICSFIGEVGLDFSREGISTKEIQLRSFRVIAERLRSSPKVVSLHSRGAETAVLDVLTEHSICSAIFHWYSGPLTTLDECVHRGHYFSVNPAMTVSQKGRKIIERIPPDQLLTESDGPHAKVSGKPSMPWDVAIAEAFLSNQWNCSLGDVRAKVWQNFRTLLSNLRLTGEVEPAKR